MSEQKRKEEISTVLSIIHSICESYQIGLIAKERNGLLFVAIKDATTGKEYVLLKSEEGSGE